MTTSTNSISDRYATVKQGSWFNQFRSGSNPWMARYVYSFMFLLATLLAWIVRDYGSKTLSHFKRTNDCSDRAYCFGRMGVLRVSMGCFMFYFLMFVSTLGTTKLMDRRETWHSRWWFAKIPMMIALTLLPFFLPSDLIEVYGHLSHFGAGVFLLVQLVSIISFITWLNDFCHSDEYADTWRVHAMILAATAYIVSILGIILIYIIEGVGALNVFFILTTAVLIHLMTIVSIRPEVNAGFLTSSLMGLYVVFLCWSAIRSEEASVDSEVKIITIISFVVAVMAIVIATFSTGIDSKSFQLRNEQEEDDDVPYGYGFFHFVFATGAMYFAMLLVGWNAKNPTTKLTIGIGWASTWVRIVNEWVAAGVYLWRIVAPIIWKGARANESQV
ncbi:probable serine incorporator [Ipomoea triloba]|uniref:probable serine incorporator n=1 Tax=Ipomoea triloba TaxID=35885 RepID=UPI00125D5011|nr:probable serine incorporator [Ipomoea triloba]